MVLQVALALQGRLDCRALPGHLVELVRLVRLDCRALRVGSALPERQQLAPRVLQVVLVEQEQLEQPDRLVESEHILAHRKVV